LRRFLERGLRNAWARHGVVGTLSWLSLLPASFVFSAAVRVRGFFYRSGRFHTSRLPVPVLSVGNLTVGGTGKTPTTVWLARELSARGHRVAILSRGYGAKVEGGRALVLDPSATSVFPQSSAARSPGDADEAVMMSALYGHTVGVARNRYECGRQVLEENPALDAFVLDDGFQHWQLARNLDLVLLGSDWRCSMLPAGPFREPLAALGRADAILVTAAYDEWKSRLDGRCDPSRVFYGKLQPCVLVSRVDQGWVEVPLRTLSGARVLGVSAIANPAPFYEMLRDWDAELVDSLEFPDHHRYTTEDWHEISRRGHAVDKIVTTEKDLVKLLRYPFATGSLCALRVAMIVERQEALLDLIEARLFGQSSEGGRV